MEFDYDGGGVAKGGTVQLFIDERQVGEGRVERTQPLPFASDEPFEIGRDLGSPVSPNYSAHEFTGDVNWVEIEIPEGEPDDDGDISAEERLEVALTKD
jgi:arylsulfatase